MTSVRAPRFQLVFVCLRDFKDLPGDSQRERHCDGCDRKVTNLAALSEQEREAFLASAQGVRIVARERNMRAPFCEVLDDEDCPETRRIELDGIPEPDEEDNEATGLMPAYRPPPGDDSDG